MLVSITTPKTTLSRQPSPTHPLPFTATDRAEAMVRLVSTCDSFPVLAFADSKWAHAGYILSDGSATGSESESDVSQVEDPTFNKSNAAETDSPAAGSTPDGNAGAGHLLDDSDTKSERHAFKVAETTAVERSTTQATPPPASPDGKPYTNVARASSGSFRFQVLSPEIRNMIYDLALSGMWPIVISTKTLRPAGASTENDHVKLTARSGRFCHEHEKDEYIRELHVTTGLLSIHPAIVKEVQSILYARNRFVFSTVKACFHFLSQIGPARRFLRHIRIMNKGGKWVNGAMTQVTMGMLIESINLQRLHLEFDIAPSTDEELDLDTSCAELLRKKKEDVATALMSSISHLLLSVCLRRGLSLDQFLSLNPCNFTCPRCADLPESAFLEWELSTCKEHPDEGLGSVQKQFLEDVKVLLNETCPSLLAPRTPWK